MSQPHAAQSYLCPHCSQTVQIMPADVAAEWTCPHCGQTFVVGESSESLDDGGRADELDGVRIRQLSHARRSAYRARSFCLIGALFCAVGVVQLTLDLLAAVLRHEAGWLSVALAIVDGLLLWGMLHLLRAARRLGIEARRSTLEPTDHPPDFSSLGDGSQRFDDLEKMR